MGARLRHPALLLARCATRRTSHDLDGTCASASYQQSGGASCVSAISRAEWKRGLHNGPDTLEGLVERHVAPSNRSHPSAGLTTTRTEALSLYREILRVTKLFTWTNEQGISWKELLRESARQEFEQARYETDPEIIARSLVVGRDAVQAALDKFAVKREKLLRKVPTEDDPAGLDWNQRPNSSQNLKVVIVNRKASRDRHFKDEWLCY